MKNDKKNKEKGFEELKNEIEEIKEKLLEDKEKILKRNKVKVDNVSQSLEEHFLDIEEKLEKLFGKGEERIGLIDQIIEMTNNDIVKIDGGKFNNSSLSMNKKIMTIDEGEFYDGSLIWNEGIIIINGGEFSDDSLEDNQGIMKIGGGEFYNISLEDNQGIMKIVGGEFYDDSLNENFGFVKIDGGKFHDMSLGDNQGIIKINEGELHDWSLSWNEGIVVINGGELHGNSLSSNYGFVKISENVALNDVVAGDMQDGLLYVMNKDAVIGGNDIYSLKSLKGGLVIAPNGAKEIHNEGAAVFTVDEDVEKAVVFKGKAKIGHKKYTASDVLKELGDYVWETSTNEYNNINNICRSIDNIYRSAIEVVKKISKKHAGKSEVIDVSELLKSYDGSKKVGEFVYEKLAA